MGLRDESSHRFKSNASREIQQITRRLTRGPFAKNWRNMKTALLLSVAALVAAQPLTARIGEPRDALIARMGKPAHEDSKTRKAIWVLGEEKEFTFLVTFDESGKSEFERVDVAATDPAKIKDAAVNFIAAQIEYAKLPENSWKDFNPGDEITFGGRRLSITPSQGAHLLLGETKSENEKDIKTGQEVKTLLFYEKGTATTPPYIWAATEQAFRRDDVARAPKDKNSAPTPPTSPSKVPSF